MTSETPEEVIKVSMDRPIARGNSRSEVHLPHYIFKHTLGIGTFGKVKLAHHVLTGEKVAIKILSLQRLNDSEEEKVRREIKILRALSHPHVIRLYEVLETKSKIYVVMEYMDRGELFYHITEKGRLRESEARYVFQQIISGVEFCHLNMVAHRDLKPENLLLDSEFNVKLADFGLSNVMRDGHFLKTSCGSPNYAAPEVILGRLYSGPEVDVWSCGVILYALLCGGLPFDSDNLPNLFMQIKKGVYTLPAHLSLGARDLISQMLVVDPMTRITVQNIRRHPWFQHQLQWYLSVPAEEIRERSRKIDEDIAREVINLGFECNYLVESLFKGVQNEATVTYYLLLDKKFQHSLPYVKYGFRDELEIATKILDHRASTSSNTSNSLQSQLVTNDVRISQSLVSPVGRDWKLGFQTPTHPNELMKDALRALQRLNVCWKKIGHYSMKCRWLPESCRSIKRTHSFDMNRVPPDEPVVGTTGVDPEAQNAVKFEMQIYITAENRYILDLQRVSGPPLLFLEICSSFLTQIQVL